MRYALYDSPGYRRKQSARTKIMVRAGKYEHLKKSITRICAYAQCRKPFIVKPSNQKRFCTQQCAGCTNSPGRTLSETTKHKISASLKGKPSPFKGVVKVVRKQSICINALCKKIFTKRYYRKQSFCSISCAASRPTSPKASRGKAGIRPDINPHIYFYSRWEANIARLYTHLGVKWQFTPKSFDIGGQNYTPDFYLPETDTYVEVKNFLGEYSRRRDEKFRKKYPKIRLELILKDQYLELQNTYAHLLPNWEFNNSKVYSSVDVALSNNSSGKSPSNSSRFVKP